ncbi:leucine rich adaptor protein 1-like [Ptychodera flava]|uniref:leucine rich adaptor protein 1-like n=1 Tax=Ptychodera flava TaxID=63121 RepID=UPI00396A6692
MDKLSHRVMDIEADEGYMNELLKEVEEKMGVCIPDALLEALNGGSRIDNATAYHSTSTAAPHGDSVKRHDCQEQTDSKKFIHVISNADVSDERNLPTQKRGKVYPAGMDSKLLLLKSELMALREMDAKLMFQLLAINDEIEEVKWMHENLELANSKESLTNSKEKMNSSRESLHEKWLEIRSSAALNNSKDSIVSSRLSLTREGSRRRLWFNHPGNYRELSKYSKINGTSDYSPPKDNYLMGRRGSSGELLKTAPPVITIAGKRRSSLDFCGSPTEILSPTNNNLLYEIEIRNEDITQL